MSKRERIAMRVAKGRLEPASRSDAERLRARRYGIGDVVFCELTKPRNPGFHRLAHAFGTMVVENIEAFEHLSAHEALKRIQIEGDIGCDALMLNMPGIGPVSYRMPRSLSYESMDESEFREVFVGMCRYVADRYWPDLDPEQVEEMAEVMAEAA